MMEDKPLFYTKHILKRMAKRGLSKHIIETVLKNGEWEKGREPFSYEIEYNGVIVIVFEQKSQYNISTCKLNRENTCKAESISREQGIDFYKALHKVVKSLGFEKEIANI